MKFGQKLGVFMKHLLWKEKILKLDFFFLGKQINVLFYKKKKVATSSQATYLDQH